MNIQSRTNTDKKDGLFVKKTKTARYHYIYDVNSNEIVKVSRIIWDVIEQFHRPTEQIVDNLKKQYSKNDILSACKSTQNAQRSGLFSSSRPKIRSARKNKDEILYIFKNGGLKQLIIDLTNQCNMRCGYCVFSGKYKYERTHSDKEISREHAIKAVDYFVRNCTKKETPYMTVYGGEPLLKFKLLRYIFDYAKSQSTKFHFSLTTNGTLLNSDEICFYLIENNISINVSLDGSGGFHDKYRVMRGGGGSFDLIMNNLKRIKEIAPDYFNSKISYSPVITPPYDFDALKSFFYKSEFFGNLKNPLNIATVSTYGTSLFAEADILIANQQFKKNRDKSLEVFRKAMISGQYDEVVFERNWFQDVISAIHFREKTPLKKYVTVLGQCIPGIRRLFVSTDGKYYICEKIGEFFCIGDVDNGLDFDRIVDFFDKCDEFFKDCSTCWALRLCKKCFADVHCEDRFDLKRKEKFCGSKLKYFETIISLYCEILEENPNAFKIFKPEDIL